MQSSGSFAPLATEIAPPMVSADVRRVVVVLIKPTHYDDAGFPYRFWRGVLPSNSLAVLNTLTRSALERELPPGVDVEVHLLEDGIRSQARQLRRLIRRFPEAGTKLIVGLVAVQTAQFPRACDLIRRWQAVGAICAIGGFHVSGSISTLLDGIKDATRTDVPCPGIMPTEIQALMDAGVIVFHGEAEEVWAGAVGDIMAGRQKPLYRGGMPDLQSAPLPEFPPQYFDDFVTEIGTFDTGRGCPFACSFCSIINVQGRSSRYRTPEAIVARVKELSERRGKVSFFFTDDNFARNPQWERVLDGLIELRQAGHRIAFLTEADLACYKIPRFLEKLAAAGCSQIFMGVESMNAANLVDARKRQNKVEQYRQLWQRCHELGMVVHAGYIVGFPHDTPESVAEDVEMLFREGADQASFFMLTPIPGSEDHVRAVAAGTPIDPDFNKCDSFHALMDHPLMTREQWFETYTKAWRQFYRPGNMIAALKRFGTREGRMDLLRNYAWYRWSFATEGTHPMIAGFYRTRDLRDRRPGSAPLSFGRYAVQEVVRHLRYVRRLVGEFYRFQHVVFETEFAPMLEEKRAQISGRMHGMGDWARLTFGRAITRQWVNQFWIDYARNRWHLLVNPLAYRWHLMMLPYIVTEVVYTLRFLKFLPRLVRTT